MKQLFFFYYVTKGVIHITSIKSVKTPQKSKNYKFVENMGQTSPDVQSWGCSVNFRDISFKGNVVFDFPIPKKKLIITKDNVMIIFWEKGKYVGEGRSNLFDYLGDFDVICANEIHQDAIVHDGNVYLFESNIESDLQQDGYCIIERHSDLEHFIDKDYHEHIEFMKWYKKEY